MATPNVIQSILSQIKTSFTSILMGAYASKWTAVEATALGYLAANEKTFQDIVVGVTSGEISVSDLGGILKLQAYILKTELLSEEQIIVGTAETVVNDAISAFSNILNGALAVLNAPAA